MAAGYFGAVITADRLRLAIAMKEAFGISVPEGLGELCTPDKMRVDRL